MLLKNDPAVVNKKPKRITDLAEKLGYRTQPFCPESQDSKNQHHRGDHTPAQQLFYVDSHSRHGTVANKAGYNLIISQSAESFEKEIEMRRDDV